jgi:hypothetical protein
VWIGSVGFEKFRQDFVAQTLALIAPSWPICTEFRAVAKQFQMLPNGKKRTKK